MWGMPASKAPPRTQPFISPGSLQCNPYTKTELPSADHDPLDHPGQLDVLYDLEDLGQGCPGFDGGPGMELAQAGIGFHCMDKHWLSLYG